MKSLLSLLLLSFLSFSAQATIPTPIPQPFEKALGMVQLKSGTNVFLEITERLQSDRMTVGQLVKMQVRTNVVVDNRIVIRSGAIAVGRVTSIAKTTYNHAEEIRIVAVHVQTVDGQLIALDGNQQSLRGEFRGQAAVVHPGTLVNARIMNNEWVKY